MGDLIIGCRRCGLRSDMSLCHVPRHFRVVALGLGLALAVLAATPAAATSAYSAEIGGDTLSVVDLESGEVRPFRTLSFLQPGFVPALQQGPDNALFAVLEANGGNVELWRIALQDGALTRLGDLAIDPGPTSLDVHFDLAYDAAAGALFLAARGRLFAVDPQTAATTALGDPQGLLAIALHEETLYGILLLPTAGPLPSPALVTLDRTSGEATLVAALSAPSPGAINAMDFDDRGTLWLLESFEVPIGPPTFQHTFYRLDDPTSGVLTAASSFSSVSPFYISLALIPGSSGDVTAVPVLDTLGTGLLIAILLVLALRTMRRPARVP